MLARDLPTPALVVDLDAFDHNVATMAAAWPGARAATPCEGVQVDGPGPAAGRRRPPRLLLRHDPGDGGHGRRRARRRPAAGQRGARRPPRSGRSVEGGARITVAVDSPETIAAAAAGGVREVLIDVCVGLPRCGCVPDDAGRSADQARGRRPRGARGHGLRGPRRRPRGPRRARWPGATSRWRSSLAAHEVVGGDDRVRRRHRHLGHATAGSPSCRPARTC